MANYKAKKAGIALHIQKKAEVRYNEEDALGTPKRIIEWINAVLKGEHEVCSSHSWRRIQFFLRDGTALCKFINKIRTAGGMPAAKFQKNALTPFVAMENIDVFNKAAEEYGLSKECTFNSGDLYEGQKGPFLNVITCLNKLGFVANEKGFTPQFEAIEAPEGNADSGQGNNGIVDS